MLHFLKITKNDEKNFRHIPCALGITTLNKYWELSFSNDTHIDLGDCYAKDKTLDWLAQSAGDVVENSGATFSEDVKEFDIHLWQFESVVDLFVPTN